MPSDQSKAQPDFGGKLNINSKPIGFQIGLR